MDALYGPRGGSASQVSSSLGGLASDLFAGNASGHAIAVLTDADPSRTFGVVELERVLQNTSNTGLLSINGVSIDELRSLGSTQEAFDLLKRLSDDAVGSAFGSAYLNGAIGDRSSLVTLFEGAGLDVSNNAQFQAATELYDFQQQNNLDSIDFSGTTRALRLLDAAGVAGDVASIAILATQAATLYNAGRHEEAGDLLESAAVSLAGGAVGGAAGGALVAALIATFVPEPSSTLIGIGTLVGILAGGVGGDVLASSIYEGIKARVEAGETLTSDDLVNVLISAEGNCFAEGTEVDLPNQKKVPIERIQIGDQVLTYGNGSKADLTIGTVTRLFKNEVSHLLDVHGLKVTPGHVTLCGDGQFSGKHVPIIDILLSDGALVRENGDLIRMAINKAVGSREDQFVQVSYAVDANAAREGNLQSGKMRVGTLLFDRNGQPVSILDCIQAEGMTFNPETGLVSRAGGSPEPLYFFGELPRPEDYILRRSRETLEGILTDGEWEGTPSQLVGQRLRQTHSLKLH